MNNRFHALVIADGKTCNIVKAFSLQGALNASGNIQGKCKETFSCLIMDDNGMQYGEVREEYLKLIKGKKLWCYKTNKSDNIQSLYRPVGNDLASWVRAECDGVRVKFIYDTGMSLG